MKRILSIFLLLVLCMLAIACSKGETTTASQTTEQTTENSTTAGTTAASTTTQSTVAPQQRPEVLPTAPEGLTETVRYECGTDGFFIIKEYFDEKEYRNIQAILEDITKKGTITQDFVVRCCSFKIALVKEILID